MPAYLWITAAALVALAVFVALGRRWWRVKWLLDWLLVLSPHRWWYSWQAAAHVLADPLESHYAQVAEYGSMVLAEEEGYWLPYFDEQNEGRAVLLPAPPVDPEPWETKRLPTRAEREQMLADLSPEALDDAADALEVVLPDAGGWISGPCLDDPGPGDGLHSVAPSPGPDQDSPASVMAPPESGVGDGIEWAVNATLKPPAEAGEPGQDWLAQQMAVTFDWVRAMVPQVTGWSTA